MLPPFDSLWETYLLSIYNFLYITGTKQCGIDNFGKITLQIVVRHKLILMLSSQVIKSAVFDELFMSV